MRSYQIPVESPNLPLILGVAAYIASFASCRPELYAPGNGNFRWETTVALNIQVLAWDASGQTKVRSVWTAVVGPERR